MTKRFAQLIRSTDEFEKISNELLHKHGFKSIKTGTGNYYTNPNKF